MRTGWSMLIVSLSVTGCLGAPGDEVAEVSQHVEGASSPTFWTRLPNLLGATQIETARAADGALALFAKQWTGELHVARQSAPSGAWGPVLALGGSVNRDFAVGLNADGRLEAFGLGTGDGAIYRQWQTAPGADTWSGWQLLGGGGFTDIAVGRHADGRLAVFTVAADKTLRVRHQTAPNGGYGAEVNEGGALSRVEVGTTGTGRMIVFTVSTVGSIYIKEQPAPNASFGSWSYFGGTQIVDIDVGTDQDGRLELVAGLSGGYIYKRSQVAPDGAWNSWYYLGGQGIGDLDTVLGPDGRLHAFAISGARAHHVSQASPGSEPWMWDPELGGTPLLAVRAERDQDGRLELFGVTTSGLVLQTWQTSPGGAWRSLPARPDITSFTVSSTNPVAGATVQIGWGLSAPAGCTPTVNLRLVYLSGATPSNLPAWVGASTGPATFTGTATFTTSSDTRVEMTATCREHQDSGFVTQDFRSIVVTPSAPQPPPPPPPTRVQAPPYQVWLGPDTVYSGARSYSAYWGELIYGGQITSLVNPNPYYISLIYAFASNNDCFTSSSVVLAPGQSTTSSDLTRLYGTTVPGLPNWLRGCANVDVGGVLPVNINYSYLK